MVVLQLVFVVSDLTIRLLLCGLCMAATEKYFDVLTVQALRIVVAEFVFFDLVHITVVRFESGAWPSTWKAIFVVVVAQLTSLWIDGDIYRLMAHTALCQLMMTLCQLYQYDFYEWDADLWLQFDDVEPLPPSYTRDQGDYIY